MREALASNVALRDSSFLYRGAFVPSSSIASISGVANACGGGSPLGVISPHVRRRLRLRSISHPSPFGPLGDVKR